MFSCKSEHHLSLIVLKLCLVCLILGEADWTNFHFVCLIFSAIYAKLYLTFPRREGTGGNYLCGQSPTQDQEPGDTDLDKVDMDWFDEQARINIICTVTIISSNEKSRQL